MFRIGEKVVYPGHGVGVVAGLQARTISGIERKFYMLHIVDNEMTIMVPAETAATTGLRPVMSKEMVTKVYRVLRTKRVEVDHQNWNRRSREYLEKIKTGSVIEIAKVLRDLLVLRTDKELSFGERKMLDTVRNLLVKEMAIASATPEEQILKDLNTLFPSAYSL